MNQQAADSWQIIIRKPDAIAPRAAVTTNLGKHEIRIGPVEIGRRWIPEWRCPTQSMILLGLTETTGKRFSEIEKNRLRASIATFINAPIR